MLQILGSGDCDDDFEVVQYLYCIVSEVALDIEYEENPKAIYYKCIQSRSKYIAYCIIIKQRMKHPSTLHSSWY
jgi:hypothetical protein